MLKQMIRMSTAMTLALFMSLAVAGPASAQDDTYPPDEPSGDITGDLDDGTDDDQGGSGDQAGGDVAGDDAAGDDDLAFTGSEFSLPLAIGAALIGGGALMYLAAAKRRDVTV